MIDPVGGPLRHARDILLPWLKNAYLLPGLVTPLALIVIAFTLILVNVVTAQGSPLSVEVSGAEYSFGQNMRFFVEAVSEAPVEVVTLFLQTPELANTLSIEVAVDPAVEIRADHEIDLTELQLAPFTTLTYWWYLQDADGNTTTTDQQSLEYVDDRFEWQAREGENVTVYWTGDDPAVGQAALDAVLQSRPQLLAIIPNDDSRGLRVYVYPSLSDLQAGLRLAGRDWVEAHSRPELGVILVAAANPKTAVAELARDIPHELSHLMVYQATGVGYGGIPLWFDEGLATGFEPAPNGNFETILVEALEEGKTIALTDMCHSFPRNEESLAYAESAAVVDYIKTTYGNLALSDMIRSVADGADCESMVERGLGLPSSELYEDWLAEQRGISPLAQIWRRGGIYLLLLMAGFVIVLIIVFSRPKQGK